MVADARLRVHCRDDPTSEFARQLTAAVEDAVHLSVARELPDPADHAVLVAGRPSDAELDGGPLLRAVVVPFAGIPPETLERLRARPSLTLHNLHHNAAPTAEFAIGLLFAVAKRIVPLDRSLRRADWRPRYDGSHIAFLLENRRLLVLGYGAIGRRVARLGVALGMEVEAIRRGGDDVERNHGVAVFPATALDERLARADALIVALPATGETHGLLGAERLSRLPEGAMVINVARGGIIDQNALYDALAAGHLGGAGLDVWYHYPESEEARAATEPAERPFFELDNVVLSPHRAGTCSDSERLRAEHLARLLRDGADRGELANPVDVELGY